MDSSKPTSYTAIFEETQQGPHEPPADVRASTYNAYKQTIDTLKYYPYVKEEAKTAIMLTTAVFLETMLRMAKKLKAEFPENPYIHTLTAYADSIGVMLLEVGGEDAHAITKE